MKFQWLFDDFTVRDTAADCLTAHMLPLALSLKSNYEVGPQH
jgi:hypothetical protein